MEGEGEGGSNRPRWALQLYQHANILFVLGLLIFPFAVGACHSGQQGGRAESLAERAREFWQARVAGDDLKAYNYEAYSKTGKMTLQQYIRARNPALKYTAYEVKGIVEKGDEATVSVEIQYHLVIAARGELDLPATLDERWVRIDGQWFRQLEKPEESQPSG